jgi:hypothetical protein
MHAMFVAHGPFSGAVKDVARIRRRASRGPDDAPGDCDMNEDGACVISGFPNVEIYNLIMKVPADATYGSTQQLMYAFSCSTSIRACGQRPMVAISGTSISKECRYMTTCYFTLGIRVSCCNLDIHSVYLRHEMGNCVIGDIIQPAMGKREVGTS